MHNFKHVGLQYAVDLTRDVLVSPIHHSNTPENKITWQSAAMMICVCCGPSPVVTRQTITALP